MAAKLLQINFKYSLSSDEYRKAAASLAPNFAAVKGLRWKVWIIDEAASTGGGIYLFEDEKALTTFLASPLVEQVKSNPAFSDLSARPFDVIADATKTCRGPV